MTNYERIKSMSIDEMAEFFCANFDFDIDSAREMLNKNFNAIYNDEIRIYNEIIQDLESEISLAEYVDRDYCNNIDLSLMKSTLDFIKRLKAENERLNAENVLTMSERNAFQTSFYEVSKQLKTAKYEAIKEFAERLKKRQVRICDCFEGVSIIDIDKFAKEMVSEE